MALEKVVSKGKQLLVNNSILTGVILPDWGPLHWGWDEMWQKMAWWSALKWEGEGTGSILLCRLRGAC